MSKHQVTRLCSLFSEQGFRWGSNLETALTDLIDPQIFTPSLVAEVLRRNDNHPSLAWRFFKWVQGKNVARCSHSSISIRAISDILCNAKMVSHLRQLCQNLYEEEDAEIAVPALWNLVIKLAKVGFVDDAYATFEELKKKCNSDVHLNVRIFNVLLEAFLKNNRPEMVRMLYRDTSQRERNNLRQMADLEASHLKIYQGTRRKTKQLLQAFLLLLLAFGGIPLQSLEKKSKPKFYQCQQFSIV